MKQIMNFKLKEFHRQWLAFQRARQYTLILAPRGHGKSTILTVGYALHRVLSNPDERVLIVSATGMQAQGFLREIRTHLEKNPRIIEIFGDQRGDRWTDREITLASRKRMAKESTLTAAGAEGAIISRHYDTIILDDVVDENAARIQTARDRMEQWFYKVLLPCLEPNGRLHVIGTRYHPDDLYGRLIAKADSTGFLN
jgi:hypothetical protein